jgi:membrane-bound metal-dependent hydrolase YbcI (DUF457 family)
MTTTGHTLTGLAIGILFLPKRGTVKVNAIHLSAFAVFANIPDLPFCSWGHNRYDISHSIFLNLLLISIAAIFLMFLRKNRKGMWGTAVMAGAAIAWLSHLLLDSFYNHGKGVAIFWPFSQTRLSLPIPWLSVMNDIPPSVTPQIIRVLLAEIATFSPLVVLAILERKTGLMQRAIIYLPKMLRR